MELIFLLVIAVVPGALFLSYILYMDRNEQEPLQLVLKTLLWGAIFAIPAGFIEVGLAQIFPIFNAEVGSGLFIAALQSFIQVAFIEEVCKLVPVLLFIWKNPEFNEENDGIVYVGASALGFAILENIFYVLTKGWTVGIMRSLSSIPLHCFTGVIMGYFVGLAKFSESSEETRKKIFIGFLIAYLFHAFYDTFALSGTALALLVIPTVILIWIFGVKLMKRGRELSLARWENLEHTNTSNTNQLEAFPSFAPNVQSLEKTSSSTEGKWKLWVSRPILFFVTIFWLLLIGGIVSEQSENFKEILIGGVILTFLPITIAVLLEISYFQVNRNLL